MAALSDDLFLLADGDAKDDRAGAKTLSFSNATSILLTFTANRFTRSAARLYQEQFRIGAMDWRMLVMLTREPGCSVAHASKTIGIDKAAVSRSLARLETCGLVDGYRDASDPRRRAWSLTKKGRRLHDQILPVALQNIKNLLTGFTPDEVEQFNDFLRRGLENMG